MVYRVVFTNGISRVCKKIDDHFVDINNKRSIIKCNHGLIYSVTLMENKNVQTGIPKG